VKSSSALIVVDEGGDEEATVGDEFSDEEDLEVFQPTDHWQTIKPGTVVRDLLALGMLGLLQ
jgi:hypothetical protein